MSTWQVVVPSYWSNAGRDVTMKGYLGVVNIQISWFSANSPSVGGKWRFPKEGDLQMATQRPCLSFPPAALQDPASGLQNPRLSCLPAHTFRNLQPPPSREPIASLSLLLLWRTLTNTSIIWSEALNQGPEVKTGKNNALPSQGS